MHSCAWSSLMHSTLELALQELKIHRCSSRRTQIRITDWPPPANGEWQQESRKEHDSSQQDYHGGILEEGHERPLQACSAQDMGMSVSVAHTATCVTHRQSPAAGKQCMNKWTKGSAPRRASKSTSRKSSAACGAGAATAGAAGASGAGAGCRPAGRLPPSLPIRPGPASPSVPSPALPHAEQPLRRTAFSPTSHDQLLPAK
jgi:hypothetical protein